LTHFTLDSGYCADCNPGVLSLPDLHPSTPAETKSFLLNVIVLNIVLLCLSSMLLDGGVISRPAGVFFSGMTIYWLFKFASWKFSKTGYPSLTFMQRILIILMPFYGFPIFYILWLLIRIGIFRD